MHCVAFVWIDALCVITDSDVFGTKDRTHDGDRKLLPGLDTRKLLQITNYKIFFILDGVMSKT